MLYRVAGCKQTFRHVFGKLACMQVILTELSQLNKLSAKENYYIFSQVNIILAPVLKLSGNKCDNVLSLSYLTMKA